MSEAGTARVQAPPPVVATAAALARHAAGIAIGAALGTVVWLVIMQDAFQRDFFGRRWSRHDFARALGKLAWGEEGTFRQRGFYATLVLAGIAVALYALAHRHVPGTWVHHVFGLAGVLFLAWGVVFGPLVASREPTENGGFFGAGAGGTAWIVAALASLAFSVVAVRIYRLMADRDWWKVGRRKLEAEATLEAIGIEGATVERQALESLELAEERREQP